MKNINFILFLILFALSTHADVLGQSGNFQHLNSAAVYFDTYANKFTKLNNDSDNRSFEPGDVIYFRLCDTHLYYAGQTRNVGGADCGSEDLGNQTYSVTLSVPTNGDNIPNFMSLLMTEFELTNGNPDFILLQFSTLSLADLGDANSVKVQSNHVQIAEGVLYKLAYTETSEDCPEVYRKITVTW